MSQEKPIINSLVPNEKSEGAVLLPGGYKGMAELMNKKEKIKAEKEQQEKQLS